MSIADKITSITGHLEDDYEALETLGVSVEDRNIENIKDMANQIYAKFPKTEYQEGTEVTLSNTLKGKLDYDNGVVGIGQTYQDSTKGYQLFQGISYSVSTSGIDFVYYTDGRITAKGIATANAFSMTTNNSSPYRFTLPSGTYIISGGSSADIKVQIINSSGTTLASDAGSGTTFTLAESTSVYIRLQVANGTNISNGITIYPMLETGSTAHDWEQYTGGQASPSPSYPQEIKCVTGNQDVVVSGKNKFNPVLQIDNTDINLTRCTAEAVNGVLKFTATAVDWYFGDVVNQGGNWSQVKGVLMEVEEGGSYNVVLSNTNIVKNFITYYDEDKKSLGNEYKSTNSFSFTASTGVKYISLRIGLGNATIVGTTYETTILVAKGNDTTYEPYITPTSYQLSLGDIELAKIGNYRDYIWKNLTNGKWYKHSEIDKYTFTGNESWTSYAYGTNSWRLANVTNSMPYAYDKILAMTTKLKGVAYNDRNNDYAQIYSEGATTITIRNTTYTTQEQVQSGMANQPVYYVLATPQETEITNTTLINQLENWYNAQSNNGTTIITSYGNLPMIIKCRGLKGE